MTNKDRRGINNFDTNTRARNNVALEFLEPIKRKGDQDTRKDKTICARQNHLLPLLPQNLTLITI